MAVFLEKKDEEKITRANAWKTQATVKKEWNFAHLGKLWAQLRNNIRKN